MSSSYISRVLIVLAGSMALFSFVGCCHRHSATVGTTRQTNSFAAVHIEFGSPREIFPVGRGGLAEVANGVVKTFNGPTHLVLNTIEERKLPATFIHSGNRSIGNPYSNGRFWANKTNNTAISQFKETPLSATDLRTVSDKAALMKLLGFPMRAATAFDARNTLVWQWFFCNGVQGDQFEALEITAGLRPSSEEIDFLLVRVGRPLKTRDK